MERKQIIKALECFHQRILDTDLAKNIYEAEIMAIIDAISLIKELTEENETLKKAKYIYATVDYCADDLAEALEENKRLTEENDRLSTALAEYEHKTNIRISEEYVHNEAYEDLREENKKLIEEAENYKKIAEYQQSSNMDRGFKIKRLNDENERLQAEITHLEGHRESDIKTVKNLKAENEKLKKSNEYYSELEQGYIVTGVQKVISDTVKKMQESIKNRLTETYGDLPHTNCFINAVDQTAKEMLEGHNE